MKKHWIQKYLLVAVVALVAIAAWADIADPGTRALSHAEWEERQTRMQEQAKEQQERENTVQEGICSDDIAFALVVVSPFLFGTLTYIELGRAIRLRRRKYLIGTAITFLLLVLSVVIWYQRLFIHSSERFAKMFAVDDPREPRIVDAKKGESYEEYQKRANRIVYHHCNRCDKPKKSYWSRGVWRGGYWLCPDCDKGEMTCSKCGAQKKPEAWMRGFEWVCPNCEK